MGNKVTTSLLVNHLCSSFFFFFSFNIFCFYSSFVMAHIQGWNAHSKCWSHYLISLVLKDSSGFIQSSDVSRAFFPSSPTPMFEWIVSVFTGLIVTPPSVFSSPTGYSPSSFSSLLRIFHMLLLAFARCIFSFLVNAYGIQFKCRDCPYV